MAISDLVPEITAYQKAQQFDTSQQMGQLQQVGTLQGILTKVRQQQEEQQIKGILSQAPDLQSAIPALAKSGPMGIQVAQHLSAVAKAQQEADMTKQLMGSGMSGLDKMNPDQLDLLGQKLALGGHPGAATVMNIADKRRAATTALAQDQATLESLQGQGQVITPNRAVAPADATDAQLLSQFNAMPPGQKSVSQGDASGLSATIQTKTGGAFAPLFDSEVPAIATAARDYQARVDAGKITGKDAEKRLETLMKAQQSYEASKNKQQFIVDNRKPPPDTTLTAEEIGPMAWEKLLFGTNPPGMGNASAAQRQQVNAERARLGRSLGLSDMEMAMLPQDNKVKMKAVDTLTKWGATVGRSAEKLDLDLGVALDYAKKLPLSQIQMVNKGVVAGMKEFNDPDANAYASAINSVRQEYARLMSGPTSNAMLPVEAMKKGNELLSSGVDVPSLEEVGRQMRRDAANTMTATQSGIEALRGSITSLGRKGAFDRGGAIPEFATEEEARKAGVKVGDRVKIGGVVGRWE